MVDRVAWPDGAERDQTGGKIYAAAYNPPDDNIGNTSLLVRYLRTVPVIKCRRLIAGAKPEWDRRSNPGKTRSPVTPLSIMIKHPPVFTYLSYSRASSIAGADGQESGPSRRFMSFSSAATTGCH